MEAILCGIVAEGLMLLSNKLKISKTYLSIILCVILGAAYYFATTYYSVQRDKLVEMIGGVYATTQVLYNMMNKFGLLDKLNGDVKKAD